MVLGVRHERLVCTILNLSSDEMIVYGNVFDSRVKNRIGAEECDPNVITIDRRRGWNCDAKLGEDVSYPTEL